MLRVLSILIISFALSACRSSDDVSSTGGASPTSQNNVSSTSQPRETIQSTGRNQGSSEPIYTAQPFAPPQTVEPVSYQSVTLEWTIPLQRENGELLGASDLDGYIIEFVDQTNPDTVDQTYVEGGQANSHSLSLPAGTYRFRVIAVDRNGLTSNPSDWVDADLA